MKVHGLGIAASVLALVAAGCGASANTASTAGPTAPSPDATPTATITAAATATADPACGVVPPELAGRWTMTLRPEDLPPELFDADTGVFVTTLGPGNYTRTDVDSDHRGAEGKACWTSDRLTFPEPCDGKAPGSYAWALRNDAVTYTEVTPDCFPRPFFLTVHPWTRVAD